MIRDIFNTEKRTPKLDNFLKICANITQLKKAKGDEVNKYDFELEKEAIEILNSNRDEN